MSALSDFAAHRIGTLAQESLHDWHWVVVAPVKGVEILPELFSFVQRARSALLESADSLKKRFGWEPTPHFDLNVLTGDVRAIMRWELHNREGVTWSSEHIAEAINLSPKSLDILRKALEVAGAGYPNDLVVAIEKVDPPGSVRLCWMDLRAGIDELPKHRLAINKSWTIWVSEVMPRDPLPTSPPGDDKQRRPIEAPKKERFEEDDNDDSA